MLSHINLTAFFFFFFKGGSFEAFRTVDDSMLSMVQIINFNVSEGQDKGDSIEGKHQLANKYTLANIFLQEFYGHTKVPQEADELLNILTSIKTDAYADTEVTLAELFFALARDFLMMDEVKAPSSEQLKSKIVQIMIQLMKQSIVPGEERLTDNVKMLLKESGIVSAFKHLAETSRNATIKSVATKIVPTLAKYIQ